jgi:hypothetical protein
MRWQEMRMDEGGGRDKPSIGEEGHICGIRINGFTVLFNGIAIIFGFEEIISFTAERQSNMRNQRMSLTFSVQQLRCR